MKATSVKELSSFLTDTMSGMPGDPQIPSGDSFSSIMETAAKSTPDLPELKAPEASSRSYGVSVQKPDTRTESEGRSADSVNENGRTEGKKTSDKDEIKAEGQKDPDRKDTGDKIQECAEKVTDELKEKLGVSDEEIEEVLSALGLTMADLLNPSDLTAVYSALTGQDGAMGVLTDETLYSGLSEILSDLQTLTDDLKAQLGMTDEQLKEAVRDFSMSKDMTSVFEDVQSEDSQELAPVSEEEDTDEMKGFGNEKKESLSEDVKGGTEQTVKETGNTARAEKSSASGIKDRPSNNESQAQSAVQTVTVQNESTAVVSEEVTFEGTSYTAQEAREIARQLVEQIRVNVSAQTTSLDMMLNPASLGHVALNIELKNGALTATFTAQNEAVKSVIENQMVILRENLESQGIKIEAVEVTVSNQAFDESLEQNRQDERSKEEASNAVRASGRRMRLNLLSPDESGEEELTEEEEINKDMMIRNGNSMDVTA